MYLFFFKLRGCSAKLSLLSSRNGVKISKKTESVAKANLKRGADSYMRVGVYRYGVYA